jgi:outer membrane protein assembly factor BamA
MRRRAILFSALLIFTAPAWAQRRTTTPSKRPAPAGKKEATDSQTVDILVSGSERYDEDDIIKASGLKKDKKVAPSVDEIRAAAQKLADSGAFAQVNYKHSASANGTKVEFIFADRDDDQFVACDFSNFVWLPEKELLMELHDRVPLFNGTVPHDGTLANEVADSLQILLKERGIDAAVTHEHEEPINDDSPSETMLYRVADVDIRIVKVELPEASPEMQSEASVAAKQITGQVYDRVAVKRFIDHNLRNIYLRHGYLKATFGAPDIKVLPEANRSAVNVSILVPVNAGHAYKAHDVRWSGNKAMLAESLDPYLHLLPGVTVDGVRLKEDVDWLRYHYAALGYLHMLLDVNPVFNDAAGWVDYQMAVKEGDLFEMGKFDVERMPSALAESLRHAWQLREGQPFDPSYLQMFVQKMKPPANSIYLVDESQGERPKSIDVTIILCGPSDPCKAKSDNRLYTPPKSDDN